MLLVLAFAPCLFAKLNGSDLADGFSQLTMSDLLNLTHCEQEVQVTSSNLKGIEGIYRVIGAQHARPLYKMNDRDDRYLYYLENGIWSFGSGR